MGGRVVVVVLAPGRDRKFFQNLGAIAFMFVPAHVLSFGHAAGWLAERPTRPGRQPLVVSGH
eukprot:824550-Prymnesium_polylepis.1